VAHLTAIKMGTRQEIVTDILRKAILGGVIAPGTKLNETSLANQLNVSRGPLREAIRELVQSGLLETRSYAGARVCKPDLIYVTELYQVRKPLEKLAYELIWDNRDTDFAEELRCRYEKLEQLSEVASQWQQVQAEIEFHSLVFERCGNAILLATWSNIADRLALSFVAHQQALIPQNELSLAHNSFVDLALDGDLQAMHDEIESHLSRGKELAQRAFETDGELAARS